MLAALAVLAFAGGVFTAYTLNRILENDPDIQAIREKERKLGDEIVYVAHDDGFGYAVVDKVQENESVPEYYAVFRVEIKDHIITDVTDAQMVEDLSEYSF